MTTAKPQQTHLVDPSRCGCRNGVACRLCVREARRRRLAAGPPVKPLAVVRRPVPCVNEGDVEKGCATCGQDNKTRECSVHGSCTRVPTAGKTLAVCATCDDYVPDPTLLPKAAAVTPATPGDYGFIPGPNGPMPLVPLYPFPVPPPPKKSRLVITAVLGDHAEELHTFTGPGQRAYADKIGAEYVVLRDRTQDPQWPCTEKWRMRDYVPLYPDGSLWLDADVFVMPDAPDVFEHVPADKVGLVDITHQPGILNWIPAEMYPLCASQMVPADPRTMAVYWNSGVWVGRPDHARYWTPPDRPFPGTWCVEEHWCRRNVFALDVPVHTMDPRFNWTWPQDREFKQWKANRPWMVHMAGMGNKPIKDWEQTTKQWQMVVFRLLAALTESGR